MNKLLRLWWFWTSLGVLCTSPLGLSQGSPELRCLFLVDSSLGMAEHRNALSNAISDKILNGFDSHIHPGENFTVWTFNETLAKNRYLPMTWSPRMSDLLAQRVSHALANQVFEGAARMDLAIAEASKLAVFSETLTVVVLSQSGTPVTGTPFDSILRERYREFTSRKPGSSFTITTLVAQKGRFAGWSIEVPGAPIAKSSIVQDPPPAPPVKPSWSRDRAPLPKEDPPPTKPAVVLREEPKAAPSVLVQESSARLSTPPVNSPQPIATPTTTPAPTPAPIPAPIPAQPISLAKPAQPVPSDMPEDFQSVVTKVPEGTPSAELPTSISPAGVERSIVASSVSPVAARPVPADGAVAQPKPKPAESARTSPEGASEKQSRAPVSVAKLAPSPAAKPSLSRDQSSVKPAVQARVQKAAAVAQPAKASLTAGFSPGMFLVIGILLVGMAGGGLYFAFFRSGPSGRQFSAISKSLESGREVSAQAQPKGF